MWLDKCLKSPVSETPFESQHAKGSQTLLESGRQQFYRFLHHSGEN